MKRIKYIILAFFTIILASCSSGKTNHSEIITNLPFNEFASFSTDSSTYRIYELANYDKGLQYYYSIYLGSNGAPLWTINYDYVYEYKTNTFFDDSTEEQLFEKINERIDSISSKLDSQDDMQLTLKRHQTIEARQVELNNITGKDGQLVTLELYIPFRIDQYIDNHRVQTTFRYLPMYTYHLLLADGMIDDYKGNEKITFNQFMNKENIRQK